MSEGGLEKTGIARAFDNGVTLITGMGAGTTYAFIGLRLKSGYSDVTVIPEALSVMFTTSDNFHWSLQFNPTVAGTFTYSDVTNSALQVAVGNNTNTITTPGTILASGYGSTQTRQSDITLNTALRIGQTIGGVKDTLVLCATSFTANASGVGSLSVRELL
jgi:hypothetical protein